MLTRWNGRPLFMPFDTDTIIRLLTGISLGGLLLAVGLRLTWREVREALSRIHIGWLLVVNFIAVPALTYFLVRALSVSSDYAAGMMLLAAAPFAPVVPIFARFAKADLALAAGLTAVFPLAASFVTPLVCEAGLRALGGSAGVRFNPLVILIVLMGTITLPVSLGVLVRHLLPKLARVALRPLEILSEAAGAISLTFVTIVEFQTIAHTPLRALVAMVIAFELSLFAGYAITAKSRDVRRVAALGTSNRNIALALLVAFQSFPNSPIVGGVVANGLVLIGLGLVHVGWWRFAKSR